ncbi:MAG: hypothetical protein ABEJ56_00805 [Candidatus Nanohaloarchaea archaeon]
MVLDLIGLGLGGGIAATAVLSFVLLLYVIFDVIVSEEMLLLEKLTFSTLNRKRASHSRI